MKKITLLLISFAMAVVLAACGGTPVPLGPCRYETAQVQMTDLETGTGFEIRYPHGWQSSLRSGNARILVTAPDFPDELAIRITSWNDIPEKQQAAQALLRRDYGTFEKIYGGWGYQNFVYQTYSGTDGNIILEVRYGIEVGEGQTARLADYYRTDIPYCVSLTLDNPAWDAQTKAMWNWNGYGLNRVALWTLDSLTIK